MRVIASQWLRARWVRSAGLGLLALGLTVYAWWPMIAAYPHTVKGDGQQYQKVLEAGRVSIVRYHEFPHWNPYECGGAPLWGDPQAWAGAPLTWSSFVIGSTAAIQLWILAHVLFAFASMWLLARRELKLDPPAALVAAGAWAFSGFHQQHYSGGHFTFVPFVYFPLAILLWRRAEMDRRSAVGLGALLAWMFYEGGVYPLPHLVVLLCVETILRSWPPRRISRIAAAGAIVGLVAFVLAASRLLPVLDQLAHHRRNISEDVDHLRWATFRDMFLARSHERVVEGQQYVWTEYGTYLGLPVLGLALAGAVAVGWEQAWLLALLALSSLLMLGHFSRWAPWSLLHAHAPFFTEMRVPSRFRASVSMVLAALAGVGVHRLSRAAALHVTSRPWSHALRVLPVIVGLIGVADMIQVGRDFIGPFFTMAPQGHVVESERFWYGGPGLAQFIDQPRQNRGRLRCWDEWGFGPGARMWEGDLPQASAVDDAMTIESVSRTQNTFTVDVDAVRPGRMLLDSTYDADWKTDVGATVDVDNQLAVDLPAAGRVRVHVRCWPRTFDAGCVLTLAGVIGVVAWLVRQRKGRITST